MEIFEFFQLVAASTTYMVILIQFDLAKMAETSANQSTLDTSTDISVL